MRGMPDSPPVSPRVAFVTLGCKVNQTESEAIARSLGLSAEAAVSREADVVVINTCTVTAESDRKARKAVRRALGLPGSPIVVVTGCLASLDAVALQVLGERVVVEADKAQVPRRVCEALGGSEAGVSALGTARSEGHSRARAQLKVADGCDCFCTYCIVPYARGLPRAVPLAAIAAEARELVAAGVGEVVLTGINIGRYDDAGARLPEVIEAVAASGVPRIRLSSIEPGDVTDRLLDVVCGTPAFCAHLHVPLQSGSDSVLRRMGRPYTTSDFAEVLARVRSALPGAAVTTDVIAGFPGETAEEAEQTSAFVEAQAFSRLHVFRYSARPGTVAATMPGQVRPEVRVQRAARLRRRGSRLAAAFSQGLSGSVVELLVERVVGRAEGLVAEGTTREYLHMAVPMESGIEAVRPGMRVYVRVIGHDEDGSVLGVVAEPSPLREGAHPSRGRIQESADLREAGPVRRQEKVPPT